MRAKFYPLAEDQLLGIWDYTEGTWGAAQADLYIRELIDRVNQISRQRYLWRSVEDEGLPSVFFIRYQHHFIFFRELSSGVIGVIHILHESMDIPRRLRDISSL